VVELGEPAEGARHHATRVEQDEDALLPLRLVLDADRTSAARGRGPRDRTRIVVRLVFPQSLEERARARDAGAPLPGVVGEPAAQRDLVAADLLQVRVHVRRRVRRHMVLPLDEVERAAEAQVHVAEAE